MKEKTVITLFWIIVIAVMALILWGCSAENMTQENPLGFNDINDAIMWFQAGQTAAQTGQAIGVATGNPAIIAGSTLALLIIGAIGSNLLKREKK